MSLTSKERVLKALNCEIPDRVPFLDFVDKELQEKIMKRKNFDPPELAQKLGLDGFSLDFFPPIAAKIKKQNGREDFVGEGLITSEQAFDELVKFPNPDNETFYKAAEYFLKQFKKEYAVWANIRWGFAPVILSMGWEGFSFALADNLQFVQKILNSYIEWTKKVVRNLNEMDLDFFWVHDDIADSNGLMVSPKILHDIFLPKAREIVNEMKLPYVYHSDGNIMPFLDELLKLGMKGIHPIEPKAMDIVQVKKKYGRRVCIIGNIDVSYTLSRGTPKETEEEVKDHISKLAPGGGYIIASSNSLSYYCRVENVLAMSRAIKKYGKY